MTYTLYEDNPDTYLSAVNSILSALGQTPVSVVDMNNPEVMMILELIKEVNKDVQAEGWIFNQEYRLCWDPMQTDSYPYLLTYLGLTLAMANTLRQLMWFDALERSPSWMHLHRNQNESS